MRAAVLTISSSRTRREDDESGNALVSFCEEAGLETVYDSVTDDREAIATAVATCGRRPDEPLRLVWIQDTLHTSVVAASEPLLDEAASLPELESVGDLFALPFDETGTLTPLAAATV